MAAFSEIFGLDGDVSFCIYKITNKINGKVYIGQTVNRVKRRWQAHCSNRKENKSPLHLAIKKYDKENFAFEVIDVAETRESLNHKEHFWIGKLNTCSPCGYNLERGGNNNKIVSADTREKISRSLKLAFERDPELKIRCTRHSIGRKFTEEEKQRQSLAIKQSHEKDPTLAERKIAHQRGKSRSDAVKNKISEKLKGINHSEERKLAIKSGMKPLTVEEKISLARHRYKGDWLVLNGRVYKSIYEVCLDFKITYQQMYKSLKRGSSSCNGIPFERIGRV